MGKIVWTIVKESKSVIGKKYRFFYHYYKQFKCLSVHYRGKCHRVKHIDCQVATESKYNKSQPFLVMQGFASELVFVDDKVIIK